MARTKIPAFARLCQALRAFFARHAEPSSGIQIAALRRRCPIWGSMHLVSLDEMTCDCGWPIAETEPRFV